MKSKIKLILFAAFLSFGTLTGCSPSGEGGGGITPPKDDEFNYTVDDSVNKLKQLGQTAGFEITIRAEGEDDDGGASVENVTIGYKTKTEGEEKVEVLWVKDETAIEKIDAGVAIYESVEGQANIYKYVGETAQLSFDQYVTSFTSAFYTAYQFSSYLVKSGSVKFLGRDATKYVFTGAIAQAYANVEVVVDNEIGIILKFAASGQDLDGNSGKGFIEVTAFKTGNEVVMPTLTKDGGGGSVTPPGEDTYPTAGKYVYNANQVRDPGIYENGYFEVEEDGSGIFCDIANYLGERHYFTGSFVLNGQDIVFTTVFSKTVGADGRDIEVAVTSTFTFSFIGDASWAITLDGHYIVYTYDQGQVTPPQLDDVVVTAQEYASLVNGMAYLGVNGNAKFNREEKRNNQAYMAETLENDYGNYQDGVAYAGLSPVVRVYERITNQPGYFNVYERKDDFSWEKAKNPIQTEEAVLFGECSGLGLLSLVPFENLTAPQSEDNPYYSCASYSYSNQEAGLNVQLTRIRIYFEKGQLVRFSYTADSYRQIEVQITDIGHVKVEIPEVKPEDKEEQHNELLYGTNSAKFVFDKMEKNGYSGTDLDVMQNCSFSFFKDGSAELHNPDAVFTGTFVLMKKDGENTAPVSISLTTRYVLSNGDMNDVSISESLTYDVTNDKLHLTRSKTEDGSLIQVDIVFKRSTEVPTPFEPTDPESKWPAKDIATALQTLGLTATVPEMPMLDNLAKDVVVTTVEKELHITCEFDTSTNASYAFAQYIDVLTEKGDYSLDYSNCDIDEGVYAFLSKDNTILLTETYVSDSTVVSLVVKGIDLTSYPTKDISDWLAKNGVTDEIIEFTCNDASYSFVDYEGVITYLIITAPEDADLSQIIKGFADELVNDYSYTVQTVDGSDLYIAPNRTIGFYFDAVDGQIGIQFIKSTNVPNPVEDTYPTAKVEEYLSDMGITDTVPVFEYENAQYTFFGGKGEDGVWSDDIAVGIDLPNGVDAEVVAEQFEALLTGYTKIGDNYVSENKQVIVNIYANDSFIGITIAPYEPEESFITFTVEYIVEDPRMEVVYLVGDFCNWDPNDENAIRFTYDAESGIWTGYMDAYVGDEIQCKLVIVNGRTGEVTRWEKEGMGNHRTIMFDDTYLELVLYWGLYGDD